VREWGYRKYLHAGINAFNKLLEEWRAKGDVEGLEIAR